jgi:hypothetical protein
VDRGESGRRLNVKRLFTMLSTVNDSRLVVRDTGLGSLHVSGYGPHNHLSIKWEQLPELIAMLQAAQQEHEQ